MQGTRGRHAGDRSYTHVHVTLLSLALLIYMKIISSKYIVSCCFYCLDYATTITVITLPTLSIVFVVPIAAAAAYTLRLSLLLLLSLLSLMLLDC